MSLTTSAMLGASCVKVYVRDSDSALMSPDFMVAFLTAADMGQGSFEYAGVRFYVERGPFGHPKAAYVMLADINDRLPAVFDEDVEAGLVVIVR